MLIKALAVILWTIAVGTITIVTVMVIYVLKQAKWESELKRYRVFGDNVINGQGHIIEHPAELLEELQGIEKRIAQ